MNSKVKVALGSYTVLAAILGFKRGVESYRYDVESNKKYKSANFFYSEAFLNGVTGSFFYSVPLVNIIMLQKEIYRLEVNLRNLEDEKKSRYYNSLT